MADPGARDPYATTVELPPPPRPRPWWTWPWSTLAGRIYLLVVLVVALFVAFTLAYERRAVELARSVERLRTDVWMRDLALNELRGFGRAADVVATLAARLDAAPITAAACADAAARRAAIDPAVRSVAVVGEDDRTVCHSDGPDVTLDVAGAEWLARARASAGPILSEAFASPRHGVPVIVVAVPGRAEGEPVVVAAAVSVAALEARLAAAGLPDGARLAIVDGTDRVVFDAPDGARVGQRLDPGTAALASEGGGLAGGVATDDRDLVAVVAVPGLDDGSRLVLSVPEGALLGSDGVDLGRAALVAGALMVLALLLASLALSRLVFRPIRVLEQAMQRVANGDLTSRVAPAARRGELQRLASAFDGMTRALRQQRRALARAADALAERELELRLLADNLADLVYATDVDGAITYASASFREVLGYDPETLVGRAPLSLVEPEDAARVASRLRDDVPAGATARVEVRLHDPTGTLRWFELIVRPRRGPDGAFEGTQGTLREVTERKHLEALLAEQALHDPLTGLPNRRSFADVVQRLLLQAKRSGELVAIGFVDLDGFKGINDTHGHQAGDVLLQEVAERLRGAVREGDVVARLGGDEFTVALRELQDERHARAVAERLAGAFAEPFDLGLTTVRVGGSVGLALFPAHGGDLEALMRAADHAMYRAKHDGDGPVVVADGVADTPGDDGPAG